MHSKLLDACWQAMAIMQLSLYVRSASWCRPLISQPAQLLAAIGGCVPCSRKQGVSVLQYLALRDRLMRLLDEVWRCDNSA